VTLKFLHTADIEQGLLAHTTYRVGIQTKNFNGEHLKLGLKFHTWAPITLEVEGVTRLHFTTAGGTKPGWSSGH